MGFANKIVAGSVSRYNPPYTLYMYMNWQTCRSFRSNGHLGLERVKKGLRILHDIDSK